MFNLIDKKFLLFYIKFSDFVFLFEIFYIFMKKFLFFYLILLSFSLFSSSIKEDYKIIHFNVNDGLSQSVANCIIQDHDDFIWVATQDGLNRFDGNSFKVFKRDIFNQNRSVTNYFYVLYEDSKNNLWIGTKGNGLVLFDRSTEIFRDFPSKFFSAVRWIVEGKDDDLFLATDNGLVKFDKKTKKFTSYLSKLNIKDLRSLDFDKNHNILWIGSRNHGFIRFDVKKNRFVIFQHNKNDKNSLSLNDVKVVFLDGLNTLWIGTRGGGLDKFNTQTHFFEHFKHSKDKNSLTSDFILSISKTKDNRLLVGTYGGGLNILDKTTKEITSFVHNNNALNSLTRNDVMSVLEDKTGVIWMGIYAGGVNLFSKYRHRFSHYLPQWKLNVLGIKGADITSVFEDKKGTVWIATFSSGLLKLDNNFNFIKRFKGKNDYFIKNGLLAIEEKDDDFLWLGTEKRGLVLFDKKSGIKTVFKKEKNKNSICGNTIYSLLQQGEILWIGCHYSGLSAYNLKKDKFYFYNPKYRKKPLRINQIILDKNKLLIATAEGLFSFDTEKKQFLKRYSTFSNPRISNDYILSLFKDEKNIYLGTFGGGLNILDLNSKTKIITKKEGLTSNTISGILKDNSGNIWVSTDAGINKIDKLGNISNYTKESGLQANKFNPRSAFKMKNGNLIFGGINGFNKFNPENIKKYKRKSKINFTRLEIFNHSVKIGKNSILKKSFNETQKITLNYDDYFVTIFFTTTDYNILEKTKYKYRLEGFGKKWYDNGYKNSISFSSLAPGKYKLLIKSVNFDGVLSDKIKSLKIVVKPPFWKSTIAYYFYSFLVLLAFYLILLMKTKASRKKIAIQKQAYELLASLTASYERFVPVEFLKLMKKDSIKNIKLGDNIEIEMGILFMDIRDFTSLSEEMTPKENFKFLNSYLKRIGPVIRNSGGFIDKYLGDGIMALFPHNPSKALEASLKIKKELEKYNKDRQKSGYKPINVGIGIHKGKLILGTIGEDKRMDGTAISDAVNTASRIEQLNKKYSTNILASDLFVEYIKISNCCDFKPIGSVKVKGKKKLINIIEILEK